MSAGAKEKLIAGLNDVERLFGELRGPAEEVVGAVAKAEASPIGAAVAGLGELVLPPQVEQLLAQLVTAIGAELAKAPAPAAEPGDPAQ